MSDERQKKQLRLPFATDIRDETPKTVARAGSLTAERGTESPTSTASLMEEVVERENLKKALRRVQSNQGSAGVDGMTVMQLPEYLKTHWPDIRSTLLSGTYQPQPVKRVEIPKPDGGVRKLGIPTVLDRFIQQALLQVLQRRFDPTFSPHSHGFRPDHSAHQAVAEAQQYLAEGHPWVVDIDLEKFFDRVNHDRLMTTLARSIADKRVLKVIRAFLNAGVMEDGLVSAIDEGTPQGGPLSPLLSNIVLDELDRELERRGHRFVRYADDCNIYVRSERAGQRVMESVKRFITRKLKLTVNQSKSAVGRPQERKFLGFMFWKRKGEYRRGIARKSIKRFRRRIRDLTRRGRGGTLEQIVAELNPLLRGWGGYFGFSETPQLLRDLDSYVRRRLRCLMWTRWRNGWNRVQGLMQGGLTLAEAKQAAARAYSPWRQSKTKEISIALPNAYFDSLGLAAVGPLKIV
jgi:RNA-directed DNA polymerase